MTSPFQTLVAVRRQPGGRTPVRRRLAAMLSALAVLSLACGLEIGSEAEGEAESNLCGLLTPEVQAALDTAMTSVLAGAALESTDVVGEGCRQRFVAGDQWVELTYQTAGADDAGFSALTESLSTDGIQTSRAKLADQSVDVIADTSDPASISTWDASLVGAGSLADNIE